MNLFWNLQAGSGKSDFFVIERADNDAFVEERSPETVKEYTEKQIKTLYRERILQLKENRSITDYRICKILGINNGNFHAFLYQGKTESISLDRIRNIYDYLSKTK